MSERARRPGQSCESCCHFIDHRDLDAGDPFGYCGQLVDALGLDKALEINPYGGHWTTGDAWCSEWKGGPNLWPMMAKR